MDIVTAVIIIGIGNGILEGIALILLHRGNLRANRILGILVIILALCIAGMLMMSLNLYETYPHLLLLTQPLLFLFGPLFWIYIELMTHRISRLEPKLLLHGVPFILCVAYLIPFFIESGTEKILLLHRWETQTARTDLIVTGLQLVHILIYLAYVLGQIRTHVLTIKEEYSSIEKIGLTWVRTFVVSICVISIVMTIFVLLDLFGFQSFVHTASGLLGLALPIGLGYYGLRQPEIFLGLGEPDISRKKYVRSAIPAEKSDQYLEQLRTMMEKEKPYHDSTLTIHTLAAKMSIPVHHLSQVLNDRLQQNFFDFVNSYRVEEVRRRISEPSGRTLTLMAIALDAGFNSKSVFNTAFRKYTCMTPSEFRKKAIEEEKASEK